MPFVNEKFMREYEELVRTVKNINGPGVSVQWGKGISIGKSGKRWERPADHPPPGLGRMIVTQIAPGGNTQIVLARKVNVSGARLGEDIAVRRVYEHTVGEYLYAAEIEGGVLEGIAITYGGKPVMWQEFAHLPAVLDIRHSTASNHIQTTIKPNPTDSDWVDKVGFADCEDPP